MEDFLRKAKQFGLGLWDFTKEKVESIVEEMVRRGEISQQDKPGVIAQLMEKAQEEQVAFKEKLKTLIQEMHADLGLARAADLEALEKRVAALEAALRSRPA